MKHLSILVLLFGLYGSIFGQTSKRISPKIDHVTVFQNKAQIDASATVNILAGNSKVILDDIASTIDQNSIKVGGKGDFVILSVKYRTNLTNKKVSAIQDSITIVGTEIENIDMLLGVVANEERMVMANSNVKSDKDGLVPEDFKEMIDFFRTKLTELGTRKLQLTRQLAPLKEKKLRLERQLASNPGSRLPTGEIELAVSAKGPVSAALSLSYVVNNVGWYPSYDVRIKNTTSPVLMAYRANVYQNTGIDWSNVKLTLSTSNPSEGGQKPELYPQFLSIFEPQPVYSDNVRAARVESKVLTMAPAPAAGSEPLMEVQSTADYTRVVESALSVNFEIDLPYSIPSGGNPELVEIRNYSLPSKFSNYILPKLDTDGFLTTEVTEWEKYKLLPGEANVYFEDTFIGKSRVAGVGTEEKMIFSLGRDKKITSKREEIENYKARKSMGSSIRESFGYRTTIRNAKSEPVTVIVQDQVPVSQDSSIEVSLEEADGAQYDKATGKVTWEVTLPPAQSRELNLKYTVKYPKDKKVNNL